MESPTNTRYQQVTVDVPEDRVAEFHAFFARFLAGRGPRGYAGRAGRGPRAYAGRAGRGPGGRHHHGHGRRCGERHEQTEQAETTAQPTEVSEV